MGKRRQPRMKLAAPVRIWREEANGTITPLTACTLDVSSSGVRLHTGGLQVGQIVALARGARRARFRVIWVGDPESDRPDQAGLLSIDGKVLFREMQEIEAADNFHVKLKAAKAFIPAS